jgi:hypothetical protein
MSAHSNFASRFFGVVARSQTYMNLLYLLFSFPLGVLYFVLLVTGFAAGIPLIIVWIGLLVLALTFAFIYGASAFERQMAISMLREDIPPMQSRDLTGLTTWQKAKATLGNPVLWKGLVYLFAKFPLGILNFVVVVTLLSVSLALITLPFYFHLVDPLYYDITIGGSRFIPAWQIDTLSEAILVGILGLGIGLVSLHAFNGLAWVSAKFARVMLGNYASPAPMPPAAPTPPAPEIPAAV